MGILILGVELAGTTGACFWCFRIGIEKKLIAGLILGGGA